MNRALRLSQAQLGRVLWIPLLGWEAGYFFWGWVADRYLADMPDRRRPARIFVLLTVLALPSVLVTQTHSLPLVLALLFWGTFVADGFVVTSLRVGMRIYPADRTAMEGRGPSIIRRAIPGPAKNDTKEPPARRLLRSRRAAPSES